jgi:hypothetical protein
VSAGAGGAKKGAGALGRASWLRIPATSAGRAELTREAHDAERERENGRAGATARRRENGSAKQREKRGVRAKKPAPTAWPH